MRGAYLLCTGAIGSVLLGLLGFDFPHLHSAGKKRPPKQLPFFPIKRHQSFTISQQKQKKEKKSTRDAVYIIKPV